MANYEISRELGKGAHGVVYKARHLESDRFVVLKKISPSKIKASRSKINQEILCLSKLNHPHVIKYISSFEEGGYLYLVMEFAENGDLDNYMKQLKQRKRRLSEQEVWKYANQLLSALQYIHDNKIMHRDIKTLNIFLDKDNNIKIGDFGISKLFEHNPNDPRHDATRIGTPLYIAPEQVQNRQYDFKVDVWAAGCVLFYLCNLEVPFLADNIISLGYLIVNSTPKRITGYSYELDQFIRSLLEKDPKKRPTAREALTKSRICAQNFSKSLMSRLSFNDSKRIGRNGEVNENNLEQSVSCNIGSASNPIKHLSGYTSPKDEQLMSKRLERPLSSVLTNNYSVKNKVSSDTSKNKIRLIPENDNLRSELIDGFADHKQESGQIHEDTLRKLPCLPIASEKIVPLVQRENQDCTEEIKYQQNNENEQSISREVAVNVVEHEQIQASSFQTKTKTAFYISNQTDLMKAKDREQIFFDNNKQLSPINEDPQHLPKSSVKRVPARPISAGVGKVMNLMDHRTKTRQMDPSLIKIERLYKIKEAKATGQKDPQTRSSLHHILFDKKPQIFQNEAKSNLQNDLRIINLERATSSILQKENARKSNVEMGNELFSYYFDSCYDSNSLAPKARPHTAYNTIKSEKGSFIVRKGPILVRPATAYQNLEYRQGQPGEFKLRTNPLLSPPETVLLDIGLIKPTQQSLINA